MTTGTAEQARRPTRRWIFLSDVHLDTVTGNRDTVRAAAQFLEHIADSPGPAPCLVLLGDVFEMLHSNDPGEAAAVDRLDAIVASNAPVIAGLRRCIGRGIVVEVVAGNHDVDLVRPALGRRLRYHLGVEETDGHVRVWPWLYVVPDVLYAEHGNQHHDLNRFPRILVPYSTRQPGAMHTPPLAAGHARAGGPAPGPIRRRLAFLAAVLATWRGEWAASQPAYRALVASLAASIGLERGLVETLERHPRLRPVSTARRLGGVFVRRRFGRAGGPPDAYLVASAEAVHRICTRWGSDFPVFVFGHTHVAADRELGEGSARYLNCGTWSPYFRHGDPAADDPGAFPFVEVVADGAGVRGSLRWWRCDPKLTGPVDVPASCETPLPPGRPRPAQTLVPAIRS